MISTEHSGSHTPLNFVVPDSIGTFQPEPYSPANRRLALSQPNVKPFYAYRLKNGLVALALEMGPESSIHLPSHLHPPTSTGRYSLQLGQMRMKDYQRNPILLAQPVRVE